MTKPRNTLLLALALMVFCFSGADFAQASGYLDVNTGWRYVTAGEDNQAIGDITIDWSDPDAQHPYDSEAYPDARIEVTVTINNAGVVFSDTGTNELTIALPGDEDPLPVTIGGDELRVDVDEDASGNINTNIRVYYYAGGQYRIDESFGSAVVEVDSGDVVVIDEEDQTPAPVAQRVVVYVIGAPTFTIDGAVTPAVNPSYIREGRTYLAIRDIAAGLGIGDADIDWDAAAREVTLTRGNKVVKVQIGSYIIKVNNVPDVMDAAPEINNGRTMLPAAFIAKAFGAAAHWDVLANTVTIK